MKLVYSCRIIILTFKHIIEHFEACHILILNFYLTIPLPKQNHPNIIERGKTNNFKLMKMTTSNMTNKKGTNQNTQTKI